MSQKQTQNKSRRTQLRQYFEILDALMMENENQNMSTISNKIVGDTIVIKDLIAHLGSRGFVSLHDTKFHTKVVSITEKGRYFWRTFRELEAMFLELNPDKKI
jgi:predicted transcriptional regulator